MGPSDVVVGADFSAAQPAEIAFRPIRASAVQAVSLLLIDALHFKLGMQIGPASGFVSIYAERTIGYTESEIVGLNYLCFFPPEAVKSGDPVVGYAQPRSTSHARRCRPRFTEPASAVLGPLGDDRSRKGFYHAVEDSAAGRTIAISKATKCWWGKAFPLGRA